MATYAVGDLQGCLDPLKRLLDKVQFDPGQDQLWLTGDLVNRGPQSLDCLRFVRSLGAHAVTVLGNHDLHLLAVVYGNQAAKRKDTLQDILEAPDRDELMDWLVNQPLMHHDPVHDRVLVHAGLPHIWSVEKARARAEEVQNCLKDSVRRMAFFAAMYGNKPASWSGKLQDMTRLRVITNYLTRMRFISKTGALELETKKEPESAPKGFKPWYLYDRKEATQIIFGHWAALMGKSGSERYVALDTGCIWGGCLTLRNLDTGEVFTTECDEFGLALKG